VKTDVVLTAVVYDVQPLWLDALEQILGRAGMRVVAKTTNEDDVLALVQEHHPDVLIASADSTEGATDRFEYVRSAHQAWSAVKSVVLGAEDDPQQIEEAFAAGASVYCVKRAAAEDLAVAIRQTFEHLIFFASRQSWQAAPAPTASETARRSNGTAGLTRRELEILRLVAEGHSNSALARMLWVTLPTVKFHLSNIYRKLDVPNRTGASRWAHLHGLVETTTSDTTPSSPLRSPRA